MGTVEVVGQLLLEIFKAYEGHINDPKVRLNARLEAKNKAKKVILEIISKETSVEKADELAIALLTSLESL
jgi:hypothetical protein